VAESYSPERGPASVLVRVLVRERERERVQAQVRVQAQARVQVRVRVQVQVQAADYRLPGAGTMTLLHRRSRPEQPRASRRGLHYGCAAVHPLVVRCRSPNSPCLWMLRARVEGFTNRCVRAIGYV